MHERWGAIVGDTAQPLLVSMQGSSKVYLIPELCCFREGFQISEGLFDLMCDFAQVLSVAWHSRDFFYSAKRHMRVFGNTGAGLAQDSSLVKSLKLHPWLPCLNPSCLNPVSPNRLLLMPPEALFLRTKEVTELLGRRSDTAYYSSARLSHAFSREVGVQCQVDAASLMQQIKEVSA